MLTRRVLLKGSAVVMAGVGAAPGWLARAAESGDAKKKILVAIFLRGAADGLNIVVPFADKRYYSMRPTIGVAPPGSPQGAIDLDGHFGLNPALDMMKPLWDKKQLAIIHATGSPDPSRSHFDAQDFMESGTPGQTSSDGWLNRALPAGSPETSPLRAIAMGNSLPRTLRGNRSAIAVNNSQQFQINGSQPNGVRAEGAMDAASILESMYAGTRDSRVGRTGNDAFAAMKMIRTVNQQPYNPAGGAQYGQGGELGRNLQQVARMIKANVGVEAAFAEVGGWDHHQNESNQLSNLLRQFGGALNAFALDMGDRMEDIVLVTMSEFGRTAEENGDGGTDHGHGDVMMVLGGRVNGGKVFGDWPGLEKEQLNDGRDLAVTTDFRAVLSELVTGQLQQKDLSRVFPGYKGGNQLGLLRT